MKNKKCFQSETSAGARRTVPTEPTSNKLRAVAFKIEDKIYEGNSGASHITLFFSLLVEKHVPADTLDTWTSDEKNNGFVTEQGTFLERSEVLRRFGAARSQDLRAMDILKTV